MNTVLLALMGPAAIGVVMGTVIAWDRLREPHRDPTKPFAVTDRRTYRDGQRRLAKLIDAEDIVHAEFVMEADEEVAALRAAHRPPVPEGLVRLAAGAAGAAPRTADRTSGQHLTRADAAVPAKHG